jgi:hypothetical protein
MKVRQDSEQERKPDLSEAIIDSQSVNSGCNRAEVSFISLSDFSNTLADLEAWSNQN